MGPPATELLHREKPLHDFSDDKGNAFYFFSQYHADTISLLSFGCRHNIVGSKLDMPLGLHR